MRIAVVLVATALSLVGTAPAAIVNVEILGSVEYTGVTFGPLSAVNPGDPVVWSFALNSDDYLDSPNFPTRGYEIDQASFTMTLGSVELALDSPFSGTPYFVIRNNDPAADGFMFSTNTDWPADLPLDEPGQIDQFASHFEVGYTEDTLISLDILDALGTYDYTGLTSFFTTLNDGPFEAMGLEFEQMSIVPEPSSLGLFALCGLSLLRRRGHRCFR